MAEPLRIGIIGLGDIGGNLAAWLIACGHRVVGFDIDDKTMDRARKAGVMAAGSRRQLIEASRIILTSLADLGAIEESYFADDGLVAQQHRDLVTLECSTVPAEFARRITAARQAVGGVAVEASVIGTGKEARDGQLYFLVAGTDEDIAMASPLLDAAGRGWQAMGASGTAAIAKLLNNGVGAVTICAIAEALALANLHGIEPAALVQAMRDGNGAGRSVVLDRHGPFMAGDPARARRFNPIALKDSQGLGDLLSALPAQALPHLAGMVETYAHTLRESDVAAPECLFRRARTRLEEIS